MKVQIVLAADAGKILTNGETEEYMVYLYGEDALPDISEWCEVPESEVGAEESEA